MKDALSAPHDDLGMRYVGRKEAANLLGISLRVLDRLARNEPTFPKASRISSHRKWYLPELMDWAKQRPS